MSKLDQSTINWLAVQKRLKSLGFNPGALDGVRGPNTDAAVVAFKRSVGLRPRPYIGRLTLKALMREREKPAKTDLPWMVEANNVRGIHEDRHHNRLTKWIGKTFGRYDWREVAWCGAFVGTCFRLSEIPITSVGNALGARNWLKLGVECGPQFGAVMVFWRGSPKGWKGHVGFYHGEDKTHYHILGGNQSDAVTVSRIRKKRLLGARWPTGHAQLRKRIFVSPNGIPITTNEA